DLVSMAPPNTYTNISMIAIGMTAAVMMVSGLRAMWRKDRPVRVAVSLRAWVVMVVPYAAVSASLERPAVRWRKISSNVGCFSTYSTVVGGRSSFRSEEIFRSEEHTSELQSRFDLVCRLLLEKKKRKASYTTATLER